MSTHIFGIFIKIQIPTKPLIFQRFSRPTNIQVFSVSPDHISIPLLVMNEIMHNNIISSKGEEWVLIFLKS